MPPKIYKRHAKIWSVLISLSIQTRTRILNRRVWRIECCSNFICFVAKFRSFTTQSESGRTFPFGCTCWQLLFCEENSRRRVHYRLSVRRRERPNSEQFPCWKHIGADRFTSPRPTNFSKTYKLKSSPRPTNLKCKTCFLDRTSQHCPLCYYPGYAIVDTNVFVRQTSVSSFGDVGFRRVTTQSESGWTFRFGSTYRWWFSTERCLDAESTSGSRLEDGKCRIQNQ